MGSPIPHLLYMVWVRMGCLMVSLICHHKTQGRGNPGIPHLYDRCGIPGPPVYPTHTYDPSLVPVAVHSPYSFPPRVPRIPGLVWKGDPEGVYEEWMEHV